MVVLERMEAGGLGAERPEVTRDLLDRGDETGEQAETRYRDLLAAAEWAALPAAVRRRFSKRLRPGEVRIYAGAVTSCRLSPAGRVLARLARLIGGPLPIVEQPGPAVVTVVEDASLGGQVWTRTFSRPGGFPQVISSAKRFGGPTGLDERLGWGIVMRLRVSVDAGDLVFTSAGYALEVGSRVISLPRWLEPGRCEVRHRDQGGGRFTFTLTLDHPWLGRLVRQVAMFRDVHVDAGTC